MSELTISKLVSEAHATSTEKGWHDPATQPDRPTLECAYWLTRALVAVTDGIEALGNHRPPGEVRRMVVRRMAGLPERLAAAEKMSSADLHTLARIALIGCEVSEAIEAAHECMTKGIGLATSTTSTSGKLLGYPSEIADVIIRAADEAAQAGVDLAKGLERKMAFNQTRPVRHGGKAL